MLARFHDFDPIYTPEEIEHYCATLKKVGTTHVDHTGKPVLTLEQWKEREMARWQKSRGSWK